MRSVRLQYTKSLSTFKEQNLTIFSEALQAVTSMHIGYQFTKFCVIMSHLSSYTSGIVFLLSKISFMYLKPQLLLITFHGGLRQICLVWKDIKSRCYVEGRVLLGMSNITEAIKSFYSNFIESLAFINDHSCPNELGNSNCNFYKDWSSSVGAIDELHLHPMRGGKLKFLYLMLKKDL